MGFGVSGFRVQGLEFRGLRFGVPGFRGRVSLGFLRAFRGSTWVQSLGLEALTQDP